MIEYLEKNICVFSTVRYLLWSSLQGCIPVWPMAVLMNFRKESTCTKQNQSKKFYKLVCIIFLSYDIFACLLLKLNHAEFGEIFDVMY